MPQPPTPPPSPLFGSYARPTCGGCLQRATIIAASKSVAHTPPAASAHIERALTPAATPSLSVRPSVGESVRSSVGPPRSNPQPVCLHSSSFTITRVKEIRCPSSVRSSARPSGWRSVLAIFVFVFPLQLQSDAPRQLQCFPSFSPGWPARRRILVHPATWWQPALVG